uniref:protein-L-isoaspartate(D-aspartate) O-methyltransferase n=1 Tax=Cacopsylla melanoneura TaxID=428564 RepID=A0A8D8RVB4_9HEMI
MLISQIHILVVIMCHQNLVHCSVTDNNDSPVSFHTSSRSNEDLGKSGSIEFITSTKKAKRTYRKRTKTSIRTRETTEGLDEVETIRTPQTTEVLDKVTTIRTPQTAETLDELTSLVTESSSVDIPEVTESQTLPQSTVTEAEDCSTFIKTSTKMSLPSKKSSSLFTRTFQQFMTKKKKTTMFNSNLYTSKPKTDQKPLDRRRVLVFGGKDVRRLTYTTKKFTPKYSPIKFQSLHQEVWDVRKLQSTHKTTERPKLKPTTTEPTTRNKYEVKIEMLKEEYDDLIIEEGEYNETLTKRREKEEIERQLREASMQKSYLYQFVVTKVTTESWEKDLPVSSKGRDEEFIDVWRERLNREPLRRKNFFIRKGKILKKIEIEKRKMEFFKNTTHMAKPESVSSEKSQDSDDVLSKNEASLDSKRKTKPFKRHKLSDKTVDHDSKDTESDRQHAKHQHVKQTQKRPANQQRDHFQSNQYTRMMQEGWAQRDLRTRREDSGDIYEPDSESRDEIERMKSYEITSNQHFVQYLKENNFTKDERILEAIHWVDRDRFAKDGYVDGPHNIGTNSIVERPAYQSFCLDQLANKLVPGANVLDLGFGSGFMSCCMARLVGDSGHVTAVDHINQLVNLLLTKLKVTYPKLYKLYKVMDVVDWDARKPYKKNGPYDVIHFGGGVKHIPLEFIPDLKINGSILVPVGPPYGPHILKKITLIKKNVYTIQNLAEVEALHFCSPEEQVMEFRQIYGHHFNKLFSLFYKPVQPYNATVTGQLQTYKLPDT